MCEMCNVLHAIMCLIALGQYVKENLLDSCFSSRFGTLRDSSCPRWTQLWPAIRPLLQLVQIQAILCHQRQMSQQKPSRVRFQAGDDVLLLREIAAIELLL